MSTRKSTSRRTSMAGTLYTYPDSFRAAKALIAAQYSGASVNVISEPPQFVLGKTNKTPEFLAKFPLGKVPAFESTDGTAIYESNAIAYYLANSQLRGSASDTAAALVQQYVNFADSEILPAACTWTFPTLGIMQYNKQATEVAQTSIKNVLSVLNKVLDTRTFLVGERVTLADISCVCNLLLLYKQVLEPSFRAPYVSVNRWFTTCINQPQFKEVLGEVQLCEKMATFDGKKYSELFPKESKGKKESSRSKEPPKKKEQPKKKAVSEDEEEEDEPPPEPAKKFVDPYIDMPKSSFVLDAFKRCYSNEDTATKAIPHFWENFDKEGWSIWRSSYKYADELKKIFMTSNLVSGMFQRLDKLRKNAFASMLILGEDNNNCVEGIWVLRGQELAFKLVEDWNIDAESYSFTKLDPDSEEDKQTINKFLLWEGDFGGKPVADGKVFK